MSRNIGLSAAGALVAVGLLTAGGQTMVSPAEAAYCHKHGQLVTKERTGTRQSKAKERARDTWNKAARKLMGTSRVHWNWAKFRGQPCRKKAGLWYCRAVATPCL